MRVRIVYDEKKQKLSKKQAAGEGEPVSLNLPNGGQSHGSAPDHDMSEKEKKT